jgi:hypothetical protein
LNVDLGDVSYTIDRNAARSAQIIEVVARTPPPSNRVVGIVRVEVPLTDSDELSVRYPLQPGAHAAARHDLEDLALALCARVVEGISDEQRVSAPP